MSTNIRIFLKKKFIKEYDLRGTLFVIDIFKPLDFQFLTTFAQLSARLFKGLVIGFGPKGRLGRMCNSVR
jgi:hypothetical protein